MFLGIPNFADLISVLDFPGKLRRFFVDFFAAQSWVMWPIRNKFTIKDKFPRNLLIVCL